MARKWVNKNYFMYGSTGSRIAGLKSTELYEGSANLLENFYITELGTLMFAKQWEKKPTGLVGQKIKLMIDTDSTFYIAITETKIHTLNKTTFGLLHSLDHGLTGITRETQATFFTNFLVIQKKFFTINTGGQIGTNNFVNTIKYPIKDQKSVRFDLHKVMKVGSTDRLALLRTYENADVTTSSTGAITLKNTDVTIKRIYKTYKGLPVLEDFTGLALGDVIAIMYDFKQADADGGYLLGNDSMTFTGSTADSKYGSPYFTGVSAKSKTGKMMFGKLINFYNDIVSTAVFQNRLVIATQDTVYYSKVFDYNNFINGIESADAFYIKPSVINNNQPKILKLDSSLGLWVTTDRGIYSIGHNVGMSPTTSVASVKIATDIPATANTVMLDDILYFMDKENVLRSCQAVYSQGTLTFLKSVVEKYDIKKRITGISKGFINDEMSLVCSTDEKRVLVYKNIDGNMFRKFELEVDYMGELFAFYNRLINEEHFFDLTNKNYAKGTIRLNPPLLKGKLGGIALNDNQSRVKEVVLNILNENKALKKVFIAGEGVNNLGGGSEFSLYKANVGFPPMNGYDLEIYTNETEDSLELRMISTLIEVHSDL